MAAEELPFWRENVTRTSEMLRQIKEYRNRYGSLGADDQAWIREEYADRAKAEFLFQVNWIEEEGFATLKETESAVLQGLSGFSDSSDKRLQQTSCLNRALCHLWSEPPGSELSVAKIQELHRLLMRAAHPELAGRLRSCPEKEVAFCQTSRGEPHVFVWPDMVATCLESLVANYNCAMQELQAREGEADQTEELLKLGASFYFEFEAIHPFVDGNGRIGRVLMALILRQVLPFPNVLFVAGGQNDGEFVGLDVYFRCFENAQPQQKFEVVNGNYWFTKEAASAGKNEAPDLTALVIEGVLVCWKRLFGALERHRSSSLRAGTMTRPTFAWNRSAHAQLA